MKVPLICAQCMKDDPPRARPIAAVELRDDGRYEVECSNGHRSLTVLQQQKFELLFEIGAYAIVDGYYREAVSSFAASLERFYEFFIRAMLFQRNLDPRVMAEAWSHVAAQSERQLGAFTFLYTLEFGRAPQVLSNARVSFRNDVIHRGKIPTRSEAVEFGQAVLDVLRPILRETKLRLSDGVTKTIVRHLSQSHPAGDQGRPVATMAVPTIVSLVTVEPSHDTQSLEEALSPLMRRRWL